MQKKYENFSTGSDLVIIWEVTFKYFKKCSLKNYKLQNYKLQTPNP